MNMLELNKIYSENCLDTMLKMPDNFIDLTVTSPPYDSLRNYKGYEFDFEPIAKELYRVTKNGGLVIWVVSDKTINGSETGSSFKQALFFKSIGFKIYDTMIWHKSSIPKTHRRYEQSFEYIFAFLKGSRPNTFNPILKENKFGGQPFTIGSKNDTAKTEIQSASNGRVKSNGYIKKQKSIAGNIFYYPVGYNLTSKDSVTFKHPAPFPEDLAKDQINTWSNQNDIVYDPFGGSGTTAKMAALLNRNWVLSEISSEYSSIAKERIEPYLLSTHFR